MGRRGPDIIISSRAVFDIASETLEEAVVVMQREDGAIVTTTSEPVYEESNGVPVKIGMVTIIEAQDPNRIEGFDPGTEYYNSPDEIPELSESEFAQMKAQGHAKEIPEMLFGDPADLSYTETIYEVYQNIEINAVPDQMFRLIQK